MNYEIGQKIIVNKVKLYESGNSDNYITISGPLFVCSGIMQNRRIAIALHIRKLDKVIGWIDSEDL